MEKSKRANSCFQRSEVFSRRRMFYNIFFFFFSSSLYLLLLLFVRCTVFIRENDYYPPGARPIDKDRYGANKDVQSQKIWSFPPISHDNQKQNKSNVCIFFVFSSTFSKFLTRFAMSMRRTFISVKRKKTRPTIITTTEETRTSSNRTALIPCECKTFRPLNVG